MAQNQNEAINATPQKRCSKRVLWRKLKLITWVAETVLQWNLAAAGAGNVLGNIGIIDHGRITLIGFRIGNQKKVKQSIQKSWKSTNIKAVIAIKAKKCIYDLTSALKIWVFMLNQSARWGTKKEF